MNSDDQEKTLLKPTPMLDVKIESVAGYDNVRSYFSRKEGWVTENTACWSSRDKMARIQPDGVGYNFEVWQVDAFPQMTYCQQLEEDGAAFDRQAHDAGL